MGRRTKNRSRIAPQRSTQATLGAVAFGARLEDALSGRAGGLWLVRPLPLAWLAVSYSPQLQRKRIKSEYQLGELILLWIAHAEVFLRSELMNSYRFETTNR